jgi:anti-sigma-K factor RskA
MADDKNSAGSGSYVLGSMDETERTEFQAQLAESEDLRNEVTELTDTAVLLGLAVEPVTPSPALKQNIMARLNQTPQLEREDEPSIPVRTLRAVPALDTERSGSAQVAPARETDRTARVRWYSRPAVLITAAAAAVALIFGGVVGANLAIQGANTSQQADGLAAITTASDVQRAEASVSTGGKVTLVWSLGLRKSALVGTGLTVLPSGKTYELWYINSAGKPTAAGLFESNGKSTLQVLSGRMSKGDTVGVTIEPSGGSKAPTTKPIVAIASA